MEKAAVGLIMDEKGRIVVKSKTKNISPKELAEIILNLDFLSEELRKIYKKIAMSSQTKVD